MLRNESRFRRVWKNHAAIPHALPAGLLILGLLLFFSMLTPSLATPDGPTFTMTGDTVAGAGISSSASFTNCEVIGQLAPVGSSFSPTYLNESGTVVSTVVAPANDNAASTWQDYR